MILTFAEVSICIKNLHHCLGSQNVRLPQPWQVLQGERREGAKRQEQGTGASMQHTAESTTGYLWGGRISAGESKGCQPQSAQWCRENSLPCEETPESGRQGNTDCPRPESLGTRLALNSSGLKLHWDCGGIISHYTHEGYLSVM